MNEKRPVVRARFARVNLVTDHLDRSMAFYRLLGVELGDMPEPWQAHHRTVTSLNAEVTMEFDSVVSVGNWAPEWASVRSGVVIGFRVDSDDEVDSLVETVESKGHLQQPHDAFFGARYAVVEDPDGIGVGIMGPIDDSRRWIPDLPG